jgi:transposase-like protein
MVNLLHLVDDAKCFATGRSLRWPTGVTCPHCQGQHIANQGFNETQPARQRYQCHGCGK